MLIKIDAGKKPHQLAADPENVTSHKPVSSATLTQLYAQASTPSSEENVEQGSAQQQSPAIDQTSFVCNTQCQSINWTVGSMLPGMPQPQG